MLRTTFYFTLHPGDMMRARIVEGAHVMIVASAFWDDERQRFRVRRPPADHISGFTIDSGGFTAAKRWGRYPWTLEQYVAWIREESRDMPVTFAACMDYACEREVNRSTYATNLERIRQTIGNEVRLRSLAPDIPWLGVLQGNTLEERQFDIRCRRRLGLLSPVMGLGSICGRGAREAADVLRYYARALPGTQYHAFGLDVRTLDQGDDISFLLASWDSYAWNWARGGNKSGRPAALFRQEGESWSRFTSRLALEYATGTIGRRLRQPRQMALIERERTAV